MRRPVWMLSLALAALMAAGSAAAGGLSLGVNEALRVPLRGAAANIVVVNPQVADVTVIDSHSIIVEGKGLGATQILVTDHAGHMLMDSRVVVGANADLTLVTGPTAQGGLPSVTEYSCSGRCQTASATTTGNASATADVASPAVTPHSPP